VSEEKFSECEEGEKCLSIEFRVFEKKRSERKVRREDFWVEILLSSCSLVGLYVCFFWKVKVTEKKEIFKVFYGSGFVSYTRWGAML